ncbi:MAG: hypothetical protein HYU67_07375 [Flavobacteriia bacterium]|nr:hypothetical protein [Flavobacteriia bacterium]
MGNTFIKQVFDSKEILQIIYENGQVKFFNAKAIIITNKKNDNSIESFEQKENTYYSNLIKIKKYNNYVFHLRDGKTIKATLLQPKHNEYYIGLENGKSIFLTKQLVSKITYLDYNFNEDKIFELLNDDYFYMHKEHSDLSINKVLLNSDDKEVLEIAQKAKKNFRNTKILLFSSSASVPLFLIGIQLFLNDFISQEDTDETNLLFFGAGATIALPLIITANVNFKKGREYNKIAIEIFNQNKFKKD